MPDGNVPLPTCCKFQILHNSTFCFPFHITGHYQDLHFKPQPVCASFFRWSHELTCRAQQLYLHRPKPLVQRDWSWLKGRGNRYFLPQHWICTGFGVFLSLINANAIQRTQFPCILGKKKNVIKEVLSNTFNAIYQANLFSSAHNCVCLKNPAADDLRASEGL